MGWQRLKVQAAPRGLYAITDPALTPPEAIVAKVERAILGGARLVQYRDKSNSSTLRQSQARALLDLCNRHHIPLIVNDDVDLAGAVHAQGVHLGSDDTTIDEARAALGPYAIIGVSCYNDFSRAQWAWRKGADYIAFGSFFPSPIKPEAVSANLDLLRRARRELELPVCAIGGITVDNAAPLIRAGADMLAVITGVFAQPDPHAAAQAFAALFD